MLVQADGDRGARERARDLALAEALVSIGQALDSRLSDVHAPPAGEQPESAAASAEPQGTVSRAVGSRGSSAVLALGTPTGMTAADVVTATGFKRPNVYPLLERLTELDYPEPVPGEQPTRWRRPQPTAG